jgi:hypothetical protein
MMRGTTISWPLAAANLVAAALVVWPWLPASAPVTHATAPPSEGVAPKLAKLAPFAEFAAITERPIFSPSRRPTPAVKAATIAIESRYRLQGIIGVGSARHALIVPVAGGAGLDLGEGDALEAWTVKTISPDRVVLTSPSGEATLAFGQAGAAANRKP